MKMEAADSLETFITIYYATEQHVPKDCVLDNRRR
jgi:hypothetical protein